MRTRPVPAARRSLLLALAVAPVLVAGGPDAAPGMDRLRYQSYPELEGKTISQVLVLGNNRTREVVFLREMRTQAGEPFRSEDLWRDWERLVDLGIFANVEVEAVPSGDGVLVVVSAYERPWWFVAPLVDYDLETKKVTYGFTARVRNYQGLNRQVNARGRFGGRKKASLSWRTPWIGSVRQTLAFDMSVDFAPDDDSFGVRSKRFTAATTRFLANYLEVRRGITAFVQIEQLNSDGVEPEVDEFAPALGAGYSRDSRNVRIDPTRGSFLALGTELFLGVSTSQARYFRTTPDARKFVRFGPGFVVAGRANATLTTGEVPFYRTLGVGGGSTIRGQRDDALRGNSRAFANLELRFPIMKQRRFGIPIPFVPSEISNFDLRIDGEVFVDGGTAWDNRGELADAHVLKGFGLGLRIFMPILELARLELAFDEEGRATVYFLEGNVI